MIIIDENFEINGTVYRRTYSDSNLVIQKIGTEEKYSEAVDLLSSNWTYEETDIPIEIPPELNNRPNELEGEPVL